MRAYPNGIPPGAREKAIAAARAQDTSRRRPLMLSANNPWFPLGPTPLDEGFPASGRATVIAANPANPAEVWLGTATGGVWHTLNAQSTDPTWQIINDLQFPDALNGGTVTPGAMAMSIGSLAVDGCTPSGCQRVWIGTGEDGSRRDTFWGSGLFLLDPQTQTVTQVKEFRYASVVSIALARDLATGTPPMTNTLYVAVSTGTTAPGTEETVSAPDPANSFGVWMTGDATNFQRLPVLPPSVDGKWLPTDIQFDPSDLSDQTLLVGVASLNEATTTGGGRYDPTAPRGILRTVNGGQTWCSVNDNSAADVTIQPCLGSFGLPPSSSVYAGLPAFTGPDEVLGQITLRFSPNPGESTTVYALVGQCGHRGRFSCPSALYRSLDSGLAWAPISLGGASTPDSYGRYTHAFAVAPSGGGGPEQLLIGGLEVYQCGITGFSGTCAVAPHSCGYCSPQTTHPDHHDLVFPDPNQPGLVYDADDGGFFWATNVLDPTSATWTSGNSQLTTNQFDGIAVVNGNILGGLQDNDMGYFVGSSDWRHRPGFGDGGQVVGYSYGSSPNTHAVWLYETYQAMPYESVDDPIAGAANDLSSNFPASALNECSYDNGVIPQQCGFFNPLAINQSTHDLYVGTIRVYKSIDTGDVRGSCWADISGPLAAPVTMEPDIETDNVITALGVGTDGTVYAGTYVGEVFVSAPGCGNSCNGNSCNSTSCTCAWTEVANPFSVGDQLPQLAISSLLVDPTNSNNAFVALSGFSTSGHVAFTNNRGQTWQNLAVFNLVDAPANVIRFDPSGNLWLGTDVGIYELRFPLEWVRDETSTLPIVPVVDIASEQDISGAQHLYAATHGRGVWEQTDPTPNVQPFNAGSPGNSMVPVYGTGFHMAGNCATGCTCTVSLVQQSGNVCTQATTDVTGGSILSDDSGYLHTSSGQQWQGKPVVWACLGNQCLGGASVTTCNQDSMGNPDPLRQVVVDCGVAGHGVGHVSGVPMLSGPPSGSLTAFDPPPKTGSPPPPPPASWTFDVAVSFTTATSAQVLCQAPVTVPQTATTDQMVTAGAAALNANPACSAAGVTAVAQMNPFAGVNADDDRGLTPALSVRGPGLTGSELFVTVRGAPGKVTDLCFDPAGLGDSVLHQATIMTTQILTAPSGAAGGSIRFVEDSDIGFCSRDVPTTAGMTSTQIVAAVAQAFRSVSAPGPAECLARSDPMDIQVHGTSFDTVLAHHLRICSFDPGVGFGVAPSSLTVPNLPPDCSAVTATPAQLWPPDHKFVPVALSGATDPDGDTVTISVDSVRQDESPGSQVDAELVAGQLLLRSERDGSGDGRVYHIDFTASDGQGGTCTGDVTVCVPHDQGQQSCVDEGPIYPSGVP